MICPSCHGCGYAETSPGYPNCTMCAGYGIIHCCEGDQACDVPNVPERVQGEDNKITPT